MWGKQRVWANSANPANRSFPKRLFMFIPWPETFAGGCAMTPDEALAIYNTGPKAVVKILCDFSNTIESQQQQIKHLEAKVAKLSKNSSNSSKPPSSDITKPKPRKKKKGKRNIGGQPGHERHNRAPFSEEEIDKLLS